MNFGIHSKNSIYSEFIKIIENIIFIIVFNQNGSY
jgi:hypothetical protein